MDDCSRVRLAPATGPGQNPAYRPAKGKPRLGGASLCLISPGNRGVSGNSSCSVHGRRPPRQLGAPGGREPQARRAPAQRCHGPGGAGGRHERAVGRGRAGARCPAGGAAAGACAGGGDDRCRYAELRGQRQDRPASRLSARDRGSVPLRHSSSTSAPPAAPPPRRTRSPATTASLTSRTCRGSSSPAPRSPPPASPSTRRASRASRSRPTMLPLEAIPRALVNGETHGLFKLVAETGSGRLLGASIIADTAGEVIQAAVLAIKAGMTVDEFASTDSRADSATRLDPGQMAAGVARKPADQVLAGLSRDTECSSQSPTPSAAPCTSRDCPCPKRPHEPASHTRPKERRARGSCMTNTPAVDALADRIAAAHPRLDPTDQRIVLTLIRSSTALAYLDWVSVRSRRGARLGWRHSAGRGTIARGRRSPAGCRSRAATGCRSCCRPSAGRRWAVDPATTSDRLGSERTRERGILCAGSS